jgi:hypothetical protein
MHLIWALLITGCVHSKDYFDASPEQYDVVIIDISPSNYSLSYPLTFTQIREFAFRDMNDKFEDFYIATVVCQVDKGLPSGYLIAMSNKKRPKAFVNYVKSLFKVDDYKMISVMKICEFSFFKNPNGGSINFLPGENSYNYQNAVGLGSARIGTKEHFSLK